MSLLDMLLAQFQYDPETCAAIEAVWDLRDMHIDASIADDMATATLANLLIEPTPQEFYTDADFVD